MNILSFTGTKFSAPILSVETPVSSYEAKCEPCQDRVAIGDEKPSVEKEAIIRSMLRKAPSEELVCDVVEALSAYPQEALERVRDFGTKVEVYDFSAGDQVPDYLPTLAQDNSLGAYNTKANVLGVDKSDLAPFVLLHEFAHALDASLGNLSESPEWKGAHKLAEFTNQVVRPYAKADSSEFMAENLAAYLISDEALYPMLEDGFAKGLGTNGADERAYFSENHNFCNGRLKSIDPQAHAMVGDLLSGLAAQPAVTSKPAMTAQEWEQWKQANAA